MPENLDGSGINDSKMRAEAVEAEHKVERKPTEAQRAAELDSQLLQRSNALFDYVMLPNTPVAFLVDDLLDPEGKLVCGYVTNVQNKRFQELPQDFVLDMDVAESVPENGQWMFKFHPMKIRRSEIISGTLTGDPIDLPIFGADYQSYLRGDKLDEPVDPKMQKKVKGKFADSKFFKSENVFIGVITGSLVIISLAISIGFALANLG